MLYRGFFIFTENYKLTELFERYKIEDIFNFREKVYRVKSVI